MNKNIAATFLVILDLDYTIWPFWADTHVSPPFEIKSKNSNNQIVVNDSRGFEIKLYPEIISILEKAKKEGIPIGTVSRTLEPNYARQLLRLLDLPKYFVASEFDTGPKVKSIEKIAKSIGISGGIKNCILFDDESRNIKDIERAGGTGVLVNDRRGLTMELFEKGINIMKNK